MPDFTIVLPAKNEAASLRWLLPKLIDNFPKAELIVVNDGSDDDTLLVCAEHGVRAISHPYPMGNGAAIKSGARAASSDVLVFMDADSQHEPCDVPLLLATMAEGFDMVVGARSKNDHASNWRSIANRFYNHLASWMTNQKVADLTSGFRAVRADKFREFLYLLPNGFSYPTTITMAFFRSGYSVAYVPIQVGQRQGKSHIRMLRDGVRFLLIIFKIGNLYSPLKLFIPIALSFFLTGLIYYSYTFITAGRLTNMGAMLFITAVLVFLIGLVSEQITALQYKSSK